MALLFLCTGIPGEAVVEYEEKMRKELLKAWAAQFKQDGIVNVGSGSGGADGSEKDFDSILSPAEMFDKMKKSGKFDRILGKQAAEKVEEKEAELNFGKEKGPGLLGEGNMSVRETPAEAVDDEKKAEERGTEEDKPERIVCLHAITASCRRI